MMDCGGADQPALAIRPREQDQRLSLGAEERLGDPALEWLQLEADPLAEHQKAAISRVYGSLGAFWRHYGHLTSIRVDFTRKPGLLRYRNGLAKPCSASRVCPAAYSAV
jgi:hypothetical protein